MVVKYINLPNHKEMDALFRMTQLTHVVLDMRVFTEGNFAVYTRISAPDQPEVISARRTLYE